MEHLRTGYSSTMVNSRFLLFVIAISTLLHGCGILNSSAKETKFNEIYNGINMNNEMKIINVKSSEIPNYLAIIKIENNSDNVINTTYNYNEKLMTYDDKNNKWLYVEDMGDYMSKDDISIPPGKSQGPKYTLYVQPKLDNMVEKIKLRVVVTGTIGENTISQKIVGAYIDINLSKD